MNRSYDEWNFMGESLDSSLHTNTENRIGLFRKLFSASFVFLLLLGIACSYSASYPMAVSQGLPHYHFLLKQLIYVAIGLTAGCILYFLSEDQFRILIPVFMFVCIIILALHSFTDIRFMSDDVVFSMTLFSVVLYLALFFSNRRNNIESLNKLLYPMAFSIFIAFLTTFRYGITFQLVYFAAVTVMFAIGGVGFGGILLLILYTAVPLLCRILGNSSELQSFLGRLVPGLMSSDDAVREIYRQQSLLSGGWLGRGLGKGLFKYENFFEITNEFVLCNITEEMGFAGFVFILLLFGIIAYSGYRCSYYIRSYSLRCSDFSAGLTTVIVWQFIINAACVFGILPFQGQSLPFFSLGSGIIVVIAECAVILRCMRPGLMKKDTEVRNDSVPSLVEEGYDEERN